MGANTEILIFFPTCSQKFSRQVQAQAREGKDLRVQLSTAMLSRNVRSWLRPDAVEAQPRWQESGAGTGHGDIPTRM